VDQVDHPDHYGSPQSNITMHQYQLQKYAGMQSRYRCPACQHRRKTFTLYINTQTNEPLNTTVGKCDREDKCGYHYTPKMWFANEGDIGSKEQRTRIKDTYQSKSLLLNPCSFIPTGIFRRSLSRYTENYLVTYLTNTLGADATRMLIDKYRIGTAKHWPGATVFWQIDAAQQVRAGKVMLYNAQTGKRVKQPFNHIAWAHKLLNLRGEELLSVAGYELSVNTNKHATQNSQHATGSKHATQNTQPVTNYKLRQCLFGEHLLAGNTLPVAIVESEKTALIASVLLPDMLWLACGGIGNLSAGNCQVLKGREVYLYPDLNAYHQWQAKAETLMHSLTIVVSNYLELHADDNARANGLDIADYLLAEYCVY
jgi:hypothetical protein